MNGLKLLNVFASLERLTWLVDVLWFVTFLLPGRLVKGLLDLIRLWLALVSLFGHLIVFVSVPDGRRSFDTRRLLAILGSWVGRTWWCLQFGGLGSCRRLAEDADSLYGWSDSRVECQGEPLVLRVRHDAVSCNAPQVCGYQLDSTLFLAFLWSRHVVKTCVCTCRTTSARS